MTDLASQDRFRFTKDWGLTFIAMIVQVVVLAFGLGAAYFRLDDNVAKTTTLITKFDAAQSETNKKFENVSVFIGEVKANYDAIKDRLARVESKIDANPKN